MPYMVNVSAINDFANCRYRWWARWILNRVPREESPALKFGTLLHFVFEKNAQYNSMYKALKEVKEEWHHSLITTHDPYERDVRMKAMATLEDLEEALRQWTDHYELQLPCLETEEPFKYQDPEDSDIIYYGRPDRVAVMDDSLWHIQTKSVAASSNFGIFIDLQKRSYHEHLYAESLKFKYPDYKYGGTLFNLIRKLKYRTRVTAKNPSGEVKQLTELFMQHPMTINLESRLHQHVMTCIRGYAQEMMILEKQILNDNYIPLPNEKMNGGYFGNKPDAYFRVLTGEALFTDNTLFKDRVDPYASTDTEE